MIRIESEGSFWFMSDDFYIRTPKDEGPREPGDWVEPEPGDALYDLEQHYHEGWVIIPTRADTKENTFPFWARINARRYDAGSFPILVIHLGSGAVALAPHSFIS